MRWITMVSVNAEYSSVEQVSPRRLHHRREEDDPDEGDRDEDLPAQPHDLVVPIAREGCANPQEDEQDRADLAEQPDEAPQAGAGNARPYRPPATEEHDRREGRDQDHVHVFGEEEHGEADAG